jgi:membrane protein implicated in regulation of membrane protease activity
MKSGLWSGHIVFRYILFQLPGLAVFVLVLLVIQNFVHIPLWFTILLVVIWTVKDAVMYPFVWRAYDKHSADSLVGMKGTATESLSPTGYVMVRGELWRAEIISGNPPVNKGETVMITGSRGLTLIVQPDTENSPR